MIGNGQNPMFMAMPMSSVVQRQPSPDEPPARVRLALEALQHFTSKTMTRVAVNDVGFQELDGQRLTSGESATQQAACEVLRDYFKGTMALDVIEVIRARRELPEGMGPGERPGRVIACFACYPGTAKPDCVLCRGTGQLLVTPTTNAVGGDNSSSTPHG